MGWILVSVLMQLGALFLLKLMSPTMPEFSLFNVLMHPMFWGALACLAGQALSWQWVLRRFELSFAYPFNSLIYPASLLLGAMFLQELVTAGRLVGVALIMAGIWVMAREARV